MIETPTYDQLCAELEVDPQAIAAERHLYHTVPRQGPYDDQDLVSLHCLLCGRYQTPYGHFGPRLLTSFNQHLGDRHGITS